MPRRLTRLGNTAPKIMWKRRVSSLMVVGSLLALTACASDPDPGSSVPGSAAPASSASPTISRTPTPSDPTPAPTASSIGTLPELKQAIRDNLSPANANRSGDKISGFDEAHGALTITFQLTSSIPQKDQPDDFNPQAGWELVKESYFAEIATIVATVQRSEVPIDLLQIVGTFPVQRGSQEADEEVAVMLSFDRAAMEETDFGTVDIHELTTLATTAKVSPGYDLSKPKK